MKLEPPNDPDDLTRLVLVMASTFLNDPATLLVGRVPDGWPSSLTPSPPVSVLGGYTVNASLSAVFLYPATTEQPLTEYRALLESDGWTATHPFSQGFESTGTAMLVREPSQIFLRRVPPDFGANGIVVSLSPSNASHAAEHARMARHYGINLPRLKAPSNVRSDSGGGSSGGGSGGDARVTHHLNVVTDLSPAELLPLYAAQLADAGWKTGEVQTTSGSALQWLEVADAEGRTWRGMLSVYDIGSVHAVFIHMATAKPDRRARPEAR